MRRGIIAAVVLLVLGEAAGAASRFVAESRDLRRGDAPVRSSTLWLDGPRLRLELDGTNTVIYRADEDAAWLIDHRARSYRRVDRETTVSVAEGVGQANASARRYIESLPPAQRQVAERLLDRTLGTPTAVSPGLELRASGATETIAGVPCALYDVRRAGQRRAEVCRASFTATGVDDETRAALRSLADSAAVVLPVLAPEHLRQDGVDALRAFERLDGVPLRVRLYEADGATFETRVREVETRAAPATAFDLPDGYQATLSLGDPGQAAPAAPSAH